MATAAVVGITTGVMKPLLSKLTKLLEEEYVKLRMIGCIRVFLLYLWICFFKEKRSQNIYVMSCDVIKLIGTANWSRARSTHGARHQELNQKGYTCLHGEPSLPDRRLRC